MVTSRKVETSSGHGFAPATVRRAAHQAQGSSAATSCPATQRGRVGGEGEPAQLHGHRGDRGQLGTYAVLAGEQVAAVTAIAAMTSLTSVA